MAQEDYLVKFYIKNFKKNGSVVKDETLMQTIPLTDTESAIKDPKIKGEIGKAGSMDFGMEPNNPYYDSMMQMKTIIRVVYAGKTIFRGRVLTIDKGFWASRQIHCEGSFAYFLDSHQEGTKEESRSTITVEKYMEQIIAAHNADVEADKRFELGEVPGKYKTASSEQRVKIPSDKAKQKFGSTSWDTAMNRLEDLLDNFGGYFRVRYDEKTQKNILDWLDKYYEDETNRQSIEVAKNLIDLSGTTEVDNLFTIVVPIGKSESDDVFISDYWPTASSGHKKVKYIQVPELATLGLCKDSELNAFYHKKTDYADAINRYGKIWKPVDFENANTPEKLFKYAVDWIKNNYMPEMTQWSVTALDLRTYDSSEQPLMVGDRVKLRHPEVVDSFGSFTVISAEYDLYHMEKTKYTIGVPNPIVNATYGVKQKQNKSGKSGGKGKGGGGGGRKNTDNPPPGGGDDFQTKLKSILQQQYSLKTDWGQDITLDNPLAFLSHNTKGQRFTAEYFMKQLRPYNKDLIQASKRYDNPLTLAVDAGKYGLDPNDPNTKTKLMGKWMVDHNPSMKEYQSYWKTTTENYMVGTLGLTEQEAGVLLNESSGTSWLAGMVDDDGNWTEEAIRRGITIRPNKDQIKQQAIATRKLLNKDEGSWAGTHIVNGIQEYIVGDKLDLGNFLFADGENLTFDLGQMFNLDGVKNIFKLISNAMNLDGEKGNAKFGLKGNWKIAINTPITYKDIDGNEHTIGGDGIIGAEDFNLPTLPSFKSKLVVVDNAIANRATIGQLDAAKARIATLEAKAITADYIASNEINFKKLTSAMGSVSAKSISGTGGVTSRGQELKIYDAYIDGDTLVLQRTIGSPVRFSKPASVKVESLGGGGSYSATPTAQHITITPGSGYDAMAACHFYISGTHNGCFSAGSMIRMADGTEEPIEQLTPGQMLVSYDSTTNTFSKSEVVSVKQYKNVKGIYELFFSSGRNTVLTDSHPLLTKNGWKAINPGKARTEHLLDEIGELTERDELVSENGGVIVEKIVHRDDLEAGGLVVYNIDVEDVDTYIVNGVVAHNAEAK